MVGLPFSKLFPSVAPAIMLIDEDEDFGRSLVNVARRLGVHLQIRRNVSDVYKNPPTETDILILGYELGRVNGIQLSQYLEHHAKAKFVVLIIDGSIEKLQVRLPECVKVIVSKDLGSEHIVRTASLLFSTLYST